MKTKRLWGRVLTVCLALWLLAAPVLALPDGGTERLALLEEILEYIEAYALYPPGAPSLDGITPRRLEEEDGLFLSLVETWLAGDKYGHFLTLEEYNAAYGVAEAAFGIGIQADIAMPLGVYVAGLLPGGGAARTGIEIGAQIVFVDGADIADADYMDVRHLFLGERWTPVEIGYLNPGSPEVFFETILRGPLDAANVQGFLIEGTDVGYISIERFGSLTDYFDFLDVYHETLPSLGAKSVIIDLRGNPGGQVDTVVNILNSMLVNEGYLLLRLLDAAEEEEFYSTGWDLEELALWDEIIWEPESIVILTDGGSASASEIFAGTLQAYGLATVVGETTFGKAHSQYHIDLTSGDILIVTSSRVELYGIGAYDEAGIAPDYEVAPAAAAGAGFMEYPLDAGRALFRQSALTERILAMQERLALLGFYRTAPSGVFDGYTLWCLNRFQAAYDLPPGRFANTATLKALDKAAREAEFYIDLSFAFALELLGWPPEN